MRIRAAWWLVAAALVIAGCGGGSEVAAAAVRVIAPYNYRAHGNGGHAGECEPRASPSHRLLRQHSARR